MWMGGRSKGLGTVNLGEGGGKGREGKVVQGRNDIVGDD